MSELNTSIIQFIHQKMDEGITNPDEICIPLQQHRKPVIEVLAKSLGFTTSSLTKPVLISLCVLHSFLQRNMYHETMNMESFSYQSYKYHAFSVLFRRAFNHAQNSYQYQIDPSSFVLHYNRDTFNNFITQDTMEHLIRMKIIKQRPPPRRVDPSSVNLATYMTQTPLRNYAFTPHHAPRSTPLPQQTIHKFDIHILQTPEQQQSTEQQECPVCYDNFNRNSIQFSCSHSLCVLCFNKMITNTKKNNCPLCRETIQSISIPFNDIEILEKIISSKNHYQIQSIHFHKTI
jgi:hypothetical protein